MRQHGNDQAIGKVLGNFGFGFEFFRAIANAVRDKEGTMLSLRRVLKETSLQEQIADLIVGVNVGLKPLGENEYLAYVDGHPLPSFADLEREFGKGRVSPLFDEAQICKHVSRDKEDAPGRKVFFIEYYDEAVGDMHAAIGKKRKQGYLPANHVEAYAFHRSYPDLECRFRIIAPGSHVLRGQHLGVTVLGDGCGGRAFANCSFDYGFPAGSHVLYIRG